MSVVTCTIYLYIVTVNILTIMYINVQFLGSVICICFIRDTDVTTYLHHVFIVCVEHHVILFVASYCTENCISMRFICQGVT